MITPSQKFRKMEDMRSPSPSGNLLVSGSEKSPKNCQRSSGIEKLIKEEMTSRRSENEGG